LLAGRFRIVQFLGSGGMGEVYEAADLDLRQHVALKLIRSESRNDPKLLSLLREEVRQARSVGHPNVCRVYDLERDDASNSIFVTMELVRGETLDARLKRAGRLRPAEAGLELDSPDRASEEMLRARAPGSAADRLDARDRERLQRSTSTSRPQQFMVDWSPGWFQSHRYLAVPCVACQLVLHGSGLK
jgi:hypothetical protein